MTSIKDSSWIAMKNTARQCRKPIIPWTGSNRHICQGNLQIPKLAPDPKDIRALAETIVFQNETISEKLGLENLYFAFNGYWPERNAGMPTASFKELEAASVLARLPETEERSIVISSAGNTGRAFLEYGSQFKINTMVVVPEFALPQMWTTIPKADCVKLVVLKDADYFDAIQLANHICELEPFFPEGGAKNVARRDGMGTVMLAGTEAINAIPDHYFQAVGSGTGAIAAWEMAWRLITDGQFGQHLPRLHLSQAESFTIMADAWAKQSRTLPEIPEEEARAAARKAYSPVLSNRKPPYGPQVACSEHLLNHLDSSMSRQMSRPNGLGNSSRISRELIWTRLRKSAWPRSLMQ